MRALQELFSIRDEEGKDSWQIAVSVLEIYLDNVYDLASMVRWGCGGCVPVKSTAGMGEGRDRLCRWLLRGLGAALLRCLASFSLHPIMCLPPLPCTTQTPESQSLDVSGMGPSELAPGQERVPGLIWTPVETLEAVEQVRGCRLGMCLPVSCGPHLFTPASFLSLLAAQLLQQASRKRSTAATALNAHSSRSHALLTVRVSMGGDACSTIHLVDLAGSERVEKSEVRVWGAWVRLCDQCKWMIGRRSPGLLLTATQP